MLKVLSHLSLPKKLTPRSRSNEHGKDAFFSEGPVLPSLGFATRGGIKHVESEDRVFTSTLSSVLRAPSRELSVSDMVSSEPEELIPEEVLVAGVFDGHGGTSCVQYVAENLGDRIGKALKKDNLRFESLEAAIIDGFKACDDDFLREAHELGNNSGCCALMAFVYQSRVIIGWSGDCRAVFFDGSKPTQLTTDHRPNEPSEWKRITDLGGNIVNNRINGVLAPSRCFGNADIRLRTPEGVIISEPSIAHVNDLSVNTLKNKTSFLILASDGVWDALSNDHACAIVARALRSNGHNAEAAALRLVEEASKLSSDDVTVCIITWSAVSWEDYTASNGRESTQAEIEKS